MSQVFVFPISVFQLRIFYYNVISFIRCQPCVEESGKCSKCGEKEEFVATPAPSKEQKAKQDAEFQNELKNLPERKRRTFLRYLEKQQKGIACSEEGKEGEEPKQFHVRHTPALALITERNMLSSIGV